MSERRDARFAELDALIADGKPRRIPAAKSEPGPAPAEPQGRWVRQSEILPARVRWYRDHRAAGLCVRCSKTAVRGHVLCAGHLAAGRKQRSAA
jgi:hypothetical protein